MLVEFWMSTVHVHVCSLYVCVQELMYRNLENTLIVRENICIVDDEVIDD